LAAEALQARGLEPATIKPKVLRSGLQYVNPAARDIGPEGTRYRLREPAITSGALMPDTMTGPERMNLRLREMDTSPEALMRGRDVSVLAHISGWFRQTPPANVNDKDLTANDGVLQHPEVARLVQDVAKVFKVDPGLLAAHILAEMKFATLLPLQGKRTFKQFIREQKAQSSGLGLDDYVKEFKHIKRAVGPVAAKSVPEGSPSAPLPAESTLDKLVNKGATPEEIQVVAKPQREFSIEEAVKASAAYLKYKEAIAKSHLGAAAFAELPREVRMQSVRLLVNPIDNKEYGTVGWIRRLKERRYYEMFDFSNSDTHATNNPKKAAHVIRRATIHTARALHYSHDMFGVPEDAE
jgi:hypothetical protein